MSSNKPHRRLSLTQATVAPDSETTAPETISETTAGGIPEGANEPAAPAALESPPDDSVVRVMAYLTQNEARALDETWFHLRRHPSRPSKSDILRAALTVALAKPEVLTDTLAQQQNSTLSRQRSSKAPKKSR